MRQQAILEGLLAGKPNAEIGAALGISAGGVKWHIGQALLETGLRGRRQLALWWKQQQETPAGCVHATGTAAELTSQDLTWISDVRIA